MIYFVKVYELIKPDVDSIEDLIEQAFRECKYNCSHSVNNLCCIYLYIILKL